MKKVLLLLVFAFSAINMAMAERVPFRDSGSDLGRIIEVQATCTSSNSILLLPRGTQVDFTIEFTALEALQGNIAVECTLLYWGQPVLSIPVNSEPFPPIPAGRTMKYKLSMSIFSSFPSISGVLRITFRDKDTGRNVISFIVDVMFV